MIKQLIALAIRHRALTLLLTMLLAVAGWRAAQTIAVDAIPDLSDVQVIVRASYPGQAPELVEQQVTYPLSSALLAVPGAKTVRGFSFFGDSYVYVIFNDGVDLYWARSRVLEYLNQARRQLPSEVEPTLGPDASGVGWVYQYAIVDRSGQHNLAQLRALQDWFLRIELQALPGVAEVATVGGMEQTFQVVVEPMRLLQYGLTLTQVSQAIRNANQEVGGSVLEMGEAEYMVRSRGYLRNAADFAGIPLPVSSEQGAPLTLADVASVRLGPQLRRGIAELNGEGEVVGGIVVMRHGDNALTTIAGVKAKLADLAGSLPPGVELVTTYDRSALIDRAVTTLSSKIVEEMLMVAIVCVLFLWHVRSSLVVVISLPLAVLMGFLLMKALNINANIMSLGGIAIAIGALVDAAIVMVENLHKHLEHDAPATQGDHWQRVLAACWQVAPALFFSLLLITVSFFPVFSLEAQEGRLFAPLAWTKTLVMAAAALLSITLVPVLLGYLVRGKVKPEQANPLVRGLQALYRPVLAWVLAWPKLTVLCALMIAASALYPSLQLRSEFMPELEEGDILYMPTTFPAVSAGKAAQILQQTDRLIKTVPEVQSVFGKVGRANTATDPAPLTMLETTIMLKPKSQWRPGISLADIIAQLQQTVTVPGMSNAWVQPIKTRIDMLATGLRTPLGLKIAGDDLTQLQALAEQAEAILQGLPGTRSAFAERAFAGRYLDIDSKREVAARYGLTLADIQQVVRQAIAGTNIDEVIAGSERYPVNLRYPERYREQLETLQDLPFVTPSGAWVTLGQVATLTIKDGPGMVRSENARKVAYVYVDVDSQAVGLTDYIAQAKVALAEQLSVPARYSLSWSGQYEYIERVITKLQQIIPITLVLVFILLYLCFHSTRDALLVMFTVPLALAGSLWLLWALNYSLSVAVVVGMIAVVGVAAEFGVIMLLYLKQALAEQPEQPLAAITAGALQRVRPKAMTVLTIVLGLLPIMLGAGTGNEVMQKIAAPMLGGMLVSPLVSMLLLPAIYWLLHQNRVAHQA